MHVHAPDLSDPAFSSLGGLQNLILAVLGPLGGSVILVAVVIAVIVCALAVHAAAIRLASESPSTPSSVATPKSDTSPARPVAARASAMGMARE